MLGQGFAFENIPEQLVAHLHVHRREELGHGRIQAGHHHMIIVHLAGMGDDRNLVRLGQRGDLARLGEAAHAVGVKLDVIHRARRLAKAPARRAAAAGVLPSSSTPDVSRSSR